MDTSHTDLLQDFSLITKNFEHLGQRLSEVAEQVRTTGALPSESLIEEIATSRRNFTDLRARTIELVGLMSETPNAAAEEIGSMKELEALLHVATEAQRKHAQQEKTRMRALTVLDQLLSLVHRDQPDFAPLSECQTKSRALREAIHDHAGPELHQDVAALAQGRHPFAELLTLTEGYDDLDDDLWLLLKHAVAENFGKSLAMSAARGKLCPSPTRMNPEHQPDEFRNEIKIPVAPAVFTDGESGPR
ncbi:MAG: hypothetical protein LZF86_50103 [Nitrospira sp.]|nr:MAG: hypothetical protein LZF86_50103 [Nitrospira sp.]